ncbi:hypothetical protein BSKO_11036 [Bryopsis sp. KO-2023]|nr:hypothetical protein BSKO_11036 [Bryopsis sp. KO-2023]
MYVPSVGDAVEVEIPDPGFEDSRWEAVVLSVDQEKGTARVQFKDLMEDEDSDKKLEEDHLFSAMMPPALNDSLTPLERRDVGDAVDCWYDGGWWKGVIYIACEDGVLVYFPSTPHVEEIKGVTQKTMDEGKERVRTGLDWEAKFKAWTKRPMELSLEGRDYRKNANRTHVKKEEGSRSGEDDDALGACQNFTVADFLERRVPYPIEQQKAISTPPRGKPHGQNSVTKAHLEKRINTVNLNKINHRPRAPAGQLSKQSPPAEPRSTLGGRITGRSDMGRTVGKPGLVRVMPGGGHGQMVAQAGGGLRRVGPSGGMRRVVKDGGGGNGRLHQPTRTPSDLVAIGGGQSLIQGRRRLVKPVAPRRPPPQGNAQAKSIFPPSGMGRVRKPGSAHHMVHPSLGPRPKISKIQRENARYSVFQMEAAGHDSRMVPHRPKLAPKPVPTKTGPSFDYETALHQRSAAGLYLGSCAGVKICVDGLGWAYDETALRTAFVELLGGVEEVHFASGMIFGSGRRYSAGYACITFRSLADAVQGMIDFDSLYLAVPGCPVHRPLIAHFPMWTDNPWGMEDVPGGVRVSAGGVPPHFCQMNAIEFFSAIEWKHLREVELMTKNVIRKKYVDQIVEVIDKHREDLGEPNREIFGWSRSTTSSRTLWLKAVSKTLSTDDLRSAFEQFDQCCKVHRLVDPVSRKETGSALVALEGEKKAEEVCFDMNTYMYVAGGTPRPLDVELVRSGAPEGFESVMDCALETAMGVKMLEMHQKYLVQVKVRKIERMDAKKQKCHQEIRKILEGMAHERAALFAKVRRERLLLHGEHEEFFRTEIKNYKDISTILEQR